MPIASSRWRTIGRMLMLSCCLLVSLALLSACSVYSGGAAPGSATVEAASSPPAPLEATATGATAAPTAGVNSDASAACLTDLDLQLHAMATPWPSSVCVQMDDGSQIIVDVSLALGAIQQLFANPALQPAFRGVGQMPNAPNGLLPVLLFEDNELRYMIDLVSYQVVEVDPVSQGSDWASGALPEAERRARAEAFVQQATPGFAGLKDQLTFEASSKSETLYFYRWEDRAAPGWTHMPPLAQVGVTANGQVVSYLNTLFLNDTGSGAPPTWTPSAALVDPNG